MRYAPPPLPSTLEDMTSLPEVIVTSKPQGH